MVKDRYFGRLINLTYLELYNGACSQKDWKCRSDLQRSKIFQAKIIRFYTTIKRISKVPQLGTYELCGSIKGTTLQIACYM